MNDKVIKVYKQCGITPLECINNLKKDNEELRLLPMTYAGRLDPLAEGLLLILVGDECLKKDQYLNLSKEYEVDVLFGFATDTYDILGLVTSSDGKFLGSKTTGDNEPDNTNLPSDFVFDKNILKNFIGKIKQSYPPYSSRPVNGKPLFAWAREGKINEIEIPTHDVFVSNIEIIEENKISGEDLYKKIKENISKVSGDFRQKEIMSLWEINLRNNYEEKYTIVRLRISCGSGVYVRVIADEIGKRLGIPSLALRIIRTKIGEYCID